ncbi:MAG: hypothetical protein V3R49_01500 [Gammaproteobacteria bacterium]
MKKFTSILLAIGILLLQISTVLAQETFAYYFEILSPSERQSYQPGDMLEIQFKTHGFQPTTRRGITVRIAERNTWKRTRIGYITQVSDDNLYTFKWKIPEDFFSRYEFANSSNFKIELRTVVDEKLVRLISSRSLLNIQTEGGPITITNSIETTATVMDLDNAEAQNAIPDELQLVAKYEFKSQYEPWMIKRLTVVNDTQGDGFEYDANEETDVIKHVYIRYLNRTQVPQKRMAGLVTGKATFKDLDLWVPDRGTASLEVYVDVIDPKRFDETYSGQTFRVGLMDTGNTASTFEAVGQFSGETDNGLNLQVSTDQVEEFVVRSGSPFFQLIGSTDRELANGDVEAYEFSVAPASDIGLSRLVFDVTQDGLTTMDQVQVFRNGTLLRAGDDNTLGKVYLMWDAGASSCFAHTQQSGVGTGMNCNGGTQASSKLILTFIQEERIFEEEANTYKLRFSVSGAGTGDRLTVRLARGDDNAKLSIGGTVSTTGKIYNSGFSNEIFSNASDLASEASTITDRNVVWTDRSASSHFYPSFTPAALPTIAASSSADYTNGYLLKLNALPTVIWTR